MKAKTAIKRPLVWCEICCCSCGGLLYGSGYNVDKNKLKAKAIKYRWKFVDGYGNVCPDCLEQILKECGEC